MICKRCGRELMQGTRFCTECGAVVEQNCPNCGCVVNDSMKFCVQCGFSFEQKDAFAASNQGYGNNAQMAMGEYGRGRKVQRWMGILNIVMGALVFLCALLTHDQDFNVPLIFCGIGVFVVGILNMTDRSEKAISINQVVFGALVAVISMDGFSIIISIIIGCPLVVSGILGLVRKSLKASAVVEIVFGGMILIMGFLETVDYVIGGMGLLLLGAVYLTIGILKLTNLKYLKS